MLDKTIPYYEVWMARPVSESVQSVSLPDGFHFAFYQEGDEAEWAQIETAVLEFSEEQEALAYFDKAFAPFPEQLTQRMLFVENDRGEKVATCTAWWKAVNGQSVPLLHWLAVKPEYQGNGLAAALVANVTARFSELEPEKTVYLHTQTWSHVAIKLYQRFGYVLIPDNIDGSKNEDYSKALTVIEEQNQQK
ncbi:GNAT family N-acetyltransferase [Candidatus Enterococcus clewellii]|uniref:N-acetyltransferase domain-containing protein n=1 Tax=Candidatus Enterococcus clewellii TaxID=1834193 RepID=A0A242KE07_9ENTE|nr:GNAT family N-acetyltransferase [Enterococcus sp. 9E7_DIV0242]OTP19404.1 hypothetical protein A5888_001221 [Enterococcus sp. 9E7_DIV0242]